ncbi:MAG: copper amine oxidase N-terminal domain-containing protein [Ignavibacteriales bacterium]
MRLNKSGIIAILVILTLLFANVLCLASSAPKVLLGGRTLSFDVPPSIDNGRTFVPLRAIFEALGADMAWNGASKTVTATKGTTTVVLTIGKPTATVNSKSVKLDAPAKVVSGRTLVPLRFVSESMGAGVAWDGSARIITITPASNGSPALPSTGLTGDKAKAYNMLTGSAYSGSANGSFKASLQEIILIGSAQITATTKSSGRSTKVSSQGVPILAGGDIKDKPCSAVPFLEIADGRDSDILEFLQKAESVSVSGDTISVKNSEPPDSIIELLNTITPAVNWVAKDLKMSGTIKLSQGKVKSLEGSLIGVAHGTSDMPATVTGSIKF